MRNLSLPQRVVLVVALGMVLTGVEAYAVPSSSGWFGYAPNTSVVFAPHEGRLGRLVLRVVLVVGWAAASLLILRPPRK